MTGYDKRSPLPWSAALVQEIECMRSQGMTWREIGQRLGGRAATSMRGAFYAARRRYVTCQP